MVPFYIYYSMFGFQRVGDFIWAAADLQVKGFLLGATAGRTTLAGEGLQHQDGHSLLLASTVPNCVAYDPCYAYELAVIVQDGLRRMYGEGESVFYYLTVMNENYTHPAMPEGVEAGILRGMYRLRAGATAPTQVNAMPRVRLLGSGTILREVEAAAAMLEADHGVAADVFSVTSFGEMRREAIDVERWNLLHPEAAPRTPYVASVLAAGTGPVVAATDYMRSIPDQVRQWVPGRFVTLGTDGFGRSETRPELRRHFQIDGECTAYATLRGLARMGAFDASKLPEVLKQLEIDAEKVNPLNA